jgi:hypothetical protein
MRLDTGEAIIIPASRHELAKEQPDGDRLARWNGTNKLDWGGRHLGIGEGPLVPAAERRRDGVIAVQTRAFDCYIGSGFGHEHSGDGKTQHFGWHGEKISPVALEIAVTDKDLTDQEKTSLIAP